jgi:heptosyltransferase I
VSRPDDLKALLIIKPGSFGDILHALPCATAIKAADPTRPITWLVDRRWRPLLEGNPAIDRVVEFPRETFRGLRALSAIPWALGLRSLRPAIALDLQGLLRSGLMARLSRARRIVGLSDAREGARWLFGETVTTEPGEHAVNRYLRTVRHLGYPVPEEPAFPLPPGQPPQSTLPDRYILLHPFARGGGKSLPPELVRTLGTHLAPRPVVLAGSGRTVESSGPSVTNLLNQTSLPELIWLIRHAAAVVSVDSGPMHLAAAAGVPLLSIHTWSDPRVVGPFSSHAWIWQGGTLRPQDHHAASLPPAAQPDAAAIADIADWAKGIFDR